MSVMRIIDVISYPTVTRRALLNLLYTVQVLVSLSLPSQTRLLTTMSHTHGCIITLTESSAMHSTI